MARESCNFGRVYDNKKVCQDACGPDEEPASCARCRGYHPKQVKRRKASQKVTYKQSGAGRSKTKASKASQGKKRR